MGAALPFIAPVIGLLQGQDQNRRANNQANDGLDMERETLKRKNEWFDTIMGIVQGADAGGEFNPETRIKSANDLSLANQGRSEAASAGASAILGYRPGDSAPLTSLRGISESYDLQRRQMDNQIRNDAFGRKLSAYGSVVAPTEGIQVGRDLYNAGQSGRQDLSGLFASIMPFLQQKRKAVGGPAFNTANTWTYGNQEDQNPYDPYSYSRRP